MLLTDYITNKARSNLTNYMINKAHKLSKDIGFSYIESEDAPNSFDDLMKAFQHSIKTKSPLPVYSGASDQTIYTNKEGNYAFRFWHDLTHCVNKLDFTLQDEIKCSMLQAEELARYFSKSSLEYKLFLADTIGQSVYAEIHSGLFPEDQLSYVKSLLEIK